VEGAAAEGAASVEWLFEGCAAALAGMGLEDATPLQAAELLIRTRKVGLIFSSAIEALRCTKGVAAACASAKRPCSRRARTTSCSRSSSTSSASAGSSSSRRC
jgi:hypothetical protein